MIPVTIPLLNPNEPDARLVQLHVHAGEYVRTGEILCTLETTKSTADLVAEEDGYVTALLLKEGDLAKTGEILCYLAERPDEKPPLSPPVTNLEQTPTSSGVELPPGLRITKPALRLANQSGLDLATLPAGQLITEEIVRNILAVSIPEGAELAQAQVDPTAIVLYGGGGHGKMLIDLLRGLQLYQIAGIIDDGMSPGALVMGLPVLGGSELLPRLFAQGIRLATNGVGGIGNIGGRISVFNKLIAIGFTCPGLVHPRSTVEPSAQLSPGAQVFANAYVGSEARIGFGCIIGTGAVVSHDCLLDDYAIISPGALLAGEVEIGKQVLVGMGATINLRVKVGACARIGNGATIKSDVPEQAIVRAGTTWPA